MSDKDHFKKMIEVEEISLFTYAYERATGQTLQMIEAGERPDFVCKRPNGRRVGVELTKAIADQLAYKWDRTSSLEWRGTSNRAQVTGYDMPWAMCRAADDKQKKVARGGWRNAKQIILVLQIVEVPLRQIKRFIDDTVLDDLKSFDFLEIWAADYSELDAYGNVELFCFKPRKWRGYHRRPPDKPYG